MDYRVGDRVWCYCKYPDHEGRIRLSTILGIDANEGLCVVRTDEEYADSTHWSLSTDSLICHDGIPARETPPEPKPPLHHEIIEARRAGFWTGMICAAGIVGSAWIAKLIYIITTP